MPTKRTTTGDVGCVSRSRHRARIARRGIESATKLGHFRWVVERSFAWLHSFRRLTVRHERQADTHQGFLTLAAVLICWGFLLNSIS
jgi:hypothetical protein